MFVPKKQGMVLETQTSAYNAPWDPFSQQGSCRNGIARKHPKHEFWGSSSSLGMSVAKNQEMAPEAQPHAYNAPWD